MKLTALLFCLMAACAQAQVDTVSEPRSGQLVLATPVGARLALQLATEVSVSVAGLVAHVEMRQKFRNDSTDWVDAEYRFPLPSRAAVHRLRLEIGARVIEGQIKEKAEARKTFERARASGRKAGLVEQRRPNLFSNRVANIGPGETVSVELHYTQRVSYRDGDFSLRLPTTLTPRYTPGHMGADAAEVWNIQLPQTLTPQQPQQSQQPLKLSASITMGMPLARVEAPYHRITLTRQGHRYEVSLVDASTPMNRDILLRWRPQPAAQPRAAVFHERIGSEEYALLMVLPPVPGQAQATELDEQGFAEARLARALPRELIFVIDTSGSMGGQPIRQARASLLFALSQLRGQDRFNIIAFAGEARGLFPSAVPADDYHLSHAQQFVERLRAGGGTEMRQALRLALPAGEDQVDGTALPRREAEEHLRQIVFITDGAVGNERELFQEIHRRLGQSRLFTVGIGAAPNGWFMRKAAQVGRGDKVIIADLAEVSSQMQSLFRRLSQPLYRNVTVIWPEPVEPYPEVLPDLYADQPLWLSVRSEQAIAGSAITVSAEGINGLWQQTLLAGPPLTDMEAAWQGIGTLWGRSAIEALLDEGILGRPQQDVRAAVLPVALKHQLLSPYTSFVAVEQQPSRPAEQVARPRAVPNLRAHGQAPQQYAWPATALGLRQQILMGVLALVVACVFWQYSALRLR